MQYTCTIRPARPESPYAPSTKEVVIGSVSLGVCLVVIMLVSAWATAWAFIEYLDLIGFQ